jgi:hypothetical protein
VITREDVQLCFKFTRTQSKLYNLICKGGLANESLFAIILCGYKRLDKAICSVTHVADWVRMASPTSPHLFKEANKGDIEFIEREINKYEHTMFIRKIAPEFPDEVLNHYIYEYSSVEDGGLRIRDPYLGQKILIYLFSSLFIYICMNWYLETIYNM